MTLKPPMRSGRQFQKEHLPRDNGRPAQQSSPRRIEGKSVFAWNAGAENRRPGFVYISVDDDFTETGHGYTGEPGEARHVFGPNLSSGPRFIIRQPDDSGQSSQVNTGPGTTHGRGLYHDHANGAQSPTPFHDGTIQDHYGDYQAEEHHVHHNAEYYREEQDETPTHRLAHENPVYYREEKHETPTHRLAHENPVYYREEKHETPTPRLAHENPVFYREEKHETPTPRLAHENPVFYREEQDETHAPRLAHANPVFYREEQDETHAPRLAHENPVFYREEQDETHAPRLAHENPVYYREEQDETHAPRLAHENPVYYREEQDETHAPRLAHCYRPERLEYIGDQDNENPSSSHVTNGPLRGMPGMGGSDLQEYAYGIPPLGEVLRRWIPDHSFDVTDAGYTGKQHYGDPHNVQSPSFTGLAAHGDPHNVQSPSFTGLAAHGDPHNVQAPSFTGLAAHGDPHNVQAPSFTGLAAHGDPHNVQSPSFTGLAAHGDPHNVQSPSFTGLTAHGDPHNVQAPSFTGLTAHGGHTFTGQGPHGDPLVPGAPLTNPQTRSSDHHFHTTTDHQSGKYAGGQQNKQFHRTYPVEPVYSEHHDHHASHGYSHGHSHGSGASYTVPHETHSSHTSGPSKPKSKNDQKTKTEKSAFGNINFICNSFDKRVQVVKSTTRRRRSPAFDVKEEYAEKSSNKLVLLCVANRQDPVKAESEG